MGGNGEWNRQVDDLLQFIDKCHGDIESCRHLSENASLNRCDSAQPHSQTANGGTLQKKVRFASQTEDIDAVTDNNDSSEETKEQSNMEDGGTWEEADEARKKARQWAGQMRVAVTQWLDEDRKLSRNRQAEQDLAEQAFRDAIAKLEDKVRELEQESKDALDRYLQGEEALHRVIATQQTRIEELEEQLRMKQSKQETIPHQSMQILQSRITELEHQIQGGERSLIDDRKAGGERSLIDDRKAMDADVSAVLSSGGTLSRKNTSVEESNVMETDETEEETISIVVEDEATLDFTPHNHATPARVPAHTPNERSVAISPDTNEDDSMGASSHSHTSFSGVPSPQASPSQNSKEDINGTKSQPRHRRQRLLSPRGHPIIQYGNGATKEVLPNGTSIVRFPNGDIQTTSGDSVAYYYSKTRVLSISQADGSVLWEFPNGQTELHSPGGKREVLGPDAESPCRSGPAALAMKEEMSDALTADHADLDHQDLFSLD